MKLAADVLVTSYGTESRLLFNKLNGALVKVKSCAIHNNKLLTDRMPKKSIEELNKMLFFESSLNKEKRLSYLESSYNANSETLQVIVELIRACNLNCSYCYQKTWGKHHKISKEILDQVYIYITKATKIHPFKTVEINFFGGEPLLAKAEILYLYKKVLVYCEERGINLLAVFDTNAVYLDIDFIQNFKSSIFSVSLSRKKDHDKYRLDSSGMGSYDKIIANLKNCSSYSAEHKFTIRYNVHKNNIDDFSSFLREINESGIQVEVYTAQLLEYEENSFSDGLESNVYNEWSATTALDLLIEYGFNVTSSPTASIGKCQAYNLYNCKVFSDGKIGLCNVTEKLLPGLDVYRIADNPRILNEWFLEYKNYSPLNDQECRSCPKLVDCGGKKYCKENRQCDCDSLDLEGYLRTYMKHCENGTGHKFVVFESSRN